MGYSVADLDGEGEGPGGMVRKLRRELGARAFGFNYFCGEEIGLRAGRFVRVDPASVRVPVAGPDGLEFLTMGAPLDGKYEPPSWG